MAVHSNVILYNRLHLFLGRTVGQGPAGSSGAGQSVSDGECWLAGHKDNHPAVVKYAGGKRLPWLLQFLSGFLGTVLWSSTVGR